jgi:hypothetical protein
VKCEQAAAILPGPDPGGVPAPSDGAIGGERGSQLGGGLYLPSSSATLDANSIRTNEAGEYGGGAYLYGGRPVLTNNVIADNRVAVRGCGLSVVGRTTRLLHSTIARNRGGDGSGIYVREDFCSAQPGGGGGRVTGSGWSAAILWRARPGRRRILASRVAEAGLPASCDQAGLTRAFVQCAVGHDRALKGGGLGKPEIEKGRSCSGEKHRPRL